MSEGIRPAIPGGLDQMGDIREKEKLPGLITERVNCFVYKLARFPMKFEKLPIRRCTVTCSRQNFETCSFKMPYASPHKRVELIPSDRNCAYGNFRSERMPRTMNTSMWLANWGSGSSLEQDCSYSIDLANVYETDQFTGMFFIH